MRARIVCAAGAALVVGCSLFVVWGCGNPEVSGNQAEVSVLTVNIVGEGTVEVRAVRDDGTKVLKNTCKGDSTQSPHVACPTELAAGTSVDLSAVSLQFWEFGSWDGLGASGTVDPKDSKHATLTLSGDQTVTATFVPGAGLTHTLRVTVDGPGKVSASDFGIACGEGLDSCLATVPHGAQVRLEATPGLNHGLLEWTWDGGRSEDAAVDVVVTGDRSLTATFRPLRKLAVEIVGSGTVVGPGIACSSGTCAASIVQGRQVTLAAEPSAGAAFVRWTWDPDGSWAGAALDFVMGAADTTYTAHFTAVYELTVTVGGNGKVVAPAVGIDCGQGATQCRAKVNQGVTVRLEAIAGTGSRFFEWTWDGGRSEAATLDVVVDGDRTVTATFRTLHTLRVEVVGSGSVAGPGIACPGTCLAEVVEGRAVTLTATPAQGYAFVGWTWASGSSTNPVLELTMGAADATYTATFTSQAATYDIDLRYTTISCAPAPVVALQPTADVAFPAAGKATFIFRRLADGVAIPLETTLAGSRATGQKGPTTDPNCLQPGVSCDWCVTPSGQTYPICYGLEIDVTFSGNAFGGKPAYLVVHQLRDPRAGVSLCMTRYDPFSGTLRGAPAKPWWRR